MFDAKPNEDDKLQDAIDEVYSEMAGSQSDSDEYAKMVDQLSKLYKLRRNPDRVSLDTLAIVLGNLLGIILIVGHERAHIVTSKAIGFVLKTRLTQ